MRSNASLPINSYAQTHHRFFAQEQVHRPAGDDGAVGWAAFTPCANIPLDAIPDLSDTQVIIYTPWEGQAPQIIQDQVTYPITTKMLSVPGAKVVRGYSFYGFSFVYVIFQGRHGPLLGAQPGAGIPQQPEQPVAGRASRRHSARTPPASAGRSCIPSTPPTATSPNCARIRIGICATNSPPCRACRKSRRSADS